MLSPEMHADLEGWRPGRSPLSPVNGRDLSARDPNTPFKAAPSSPKTPDSAVSTVASPTDRLNPSPDIDRAPLRVDLLGGALAPEKVPTWEAFGMVFGVFAGYACLFTLQHEIKAHYGIADDASAESRNFSAYVSCLYLGNLIFRFAHNLVSAWISPRGRVLGCFGAMILSLSILGAVSLSTDPSIVWVPVAYLLGGACVGTFEANMLTMLTPYGDVSKRWAVTAIPFGITLVTIGAFLVLQAGVPLAGIYFFVVALLVCGIGLVAMRIPSKATRVSGAFTDDMRAWREWLPKMWTMPHAFTIDMFSVSLFCPALVLFIYDKPTVSVFGAPMSTKLFLSIYDLATFVGGAVGRYMSYRTEKIRHPAVFNFLNIIGVAMVLSKIPEIAPIAGVLIMLGDGCVYGYTCRNIDAKVPRRYTLVATSLWLFVGDIGSVAGSNSLFYIRNWIGGGH